MKRIRGGSGIGDAIYVRVVAEHFIKSGEEVVACSAHPDIFDGSGAVIEPFRRDQIDVVAHYTMGKNNPSTSQWQDICNTAGVGSIPLQFGWTVKNRSLIEDLRCQAAGRPIVVVHGGRAPMARTDGFGAELMPDRKTFDSVLESLQDCFLVQVGRGDQVYPLKADLNLNGKTSIFDLFDIAMACSGMVAQCSFMVPLAECFDKPLLAIWAHRGLSSGRHQYISTITPQKILCKPTSHFVIDDWPEEKIQGDARAFRRLF